VRVAPGTRRGDGRGSAPLQRLRELPSVKAVDFDEENLDIVVQFDRGASDAEGVIGQVIAALLANDVRISGVSKGRGLEQRVMDLTEDRGRS
jgi:ABC-2 type transport system ATP-binding protein